MAGHNRRQRAENRPAEQVEITQNVQNLVASKFVFKPQLRIHDFFIIDQNEIAEAPTVGQSHILQLRNIFQKAERASRRDLRFEKLRAVKHVKMFLLAYRLGITQEVAHGKILRRLDFDRLTAFGINPIFPVNHDRGYLFVLLFDAGLIDRLTKLQCRSIQNRNLSLYFDQQVADSVTMQYRKQVFHRPDGIVLGSERSRVSGGADVVQMRRDRDIAGDAGENNAAVRRQWM